ncbi:uracil phosphoribosyltransferase [Belliella buryatensis]|uniref:Uracil phosphoribosyltransferase n=1 Tax=Belliella buryatensis TaxID=1500549 RepID=A0A239B3J7_9BACT|nr:uracil phosphoribosyltransferase [Belliella buryatensis]SNS02447.1 uracil phosphoribosyltransferase [Belliella buryatensis]
MFILNQQNSIANTFLAEIRNIKVQNDRLRFRKNLERLGELLAYEISKSLSFKQELITTPLKETSLNLISDQPVLISVLRAAMPFYQGFLNIYDQADSGFIGAYRTEEVKDGAEIEISLLYQAAPNIEGKEVILIDPMLASGKSFLKSIENLKKNGTPKMIHIASVIAAPEGVDFLKQNINLPYKLWTCALDEKLNPNSYIVPGLGDAGDLAFGQKL